jgi:hypothetical protein
MIDDTPAMAYAKRRATGGKRDDEWITICHGGIYVNPLILPWTSWKTALNQALVWVGLDKR